MRVSPYKEFLTHASRSGDAVIAAVADNCRFDERASAKRWQQFETMLPSPQADSGAIEWADLVETYQLHMEQHYKVARPSVPDAFLKINRGAWLGKLSENQSLVRIEDINRALQACTLELDNLENLLQRAKGGDGDAERAVGTFFEAWNQRRDARPAFVAFSDEVQEELDDDDWPHALRDRLGLGHYGHAESPARPIALMRYSLADVFKSQARHQAACALPTVLDGGMHEFFFPVPQEHLYGAAVHLVPARANTLTAELIHCRIDYERRHLYRLGKITRPTRLDDDQLIKARDLHLRALRVECDREDFGEPLKGRPCATVG